MTTAERLRAEGRVEGEAQVLLKLLTAKFEILPAEVVDRVRSADTDELEAWMPRVLTATTLNEVFNPA